MPTATNSKTCDTPLWREALKTLAPLNRVHVGPDMSAAYKMLGTFYPVELFGYEAGSKSGSWEAPPGWKVNSAKLTGPDGKIVVEWGPDALLSLHTYSPSFTGTLSRTALEQHLLSDPNRPKDTIFHFRNQYRVHEAQWGFSIPFDVHKNLPQGDYKVDIDTEYTKEPMEMAMQTHVGANKESILFVGHFDHPAQAADGLIGCIAGHEVIQRLADRHTKYTYRMLSTVEIVGSVFYCEGRAKQDCISHAMFSAMSGAKAPLIYCTTARGNSYLDKAMCHILKHIPEDTRTIGFRESIGNDEIAFDVAGVDIPCGSLVRWPYEHYHSAEDTPEKIYGTEFENYVEAYLTLIDIIEENALLVAKFKGLPKLSAPEIDLYLSPPQISGIEDKQTSVTGRLMASLRNDHVRAQVITVKEKFNYMMTLVPALADGEHSVLDIAEKAGVPFNLVNKYTDMWVEKGLLEKRWIKPY